MNRNTLGTSVWVKRRASGGWHYGIKEADGTPLPKGIAFTEAEAGEKARKELTEYRARLTQVTWKDGWVDEFRKGRQKYHARRAKLKQRLLEAANED